MISYWEKETFFATQDFIIIGAGFTGLWTAIELKTKYKKAKITVLERGPVPIGASTKNAGFSCFGSPTELLKDAEDDGENEMWSLVEKRYEGLRKIHNTFSYLTIEYENNGGYECLNKKDFEKVMSKMDWLNKGLQKITTNQNTFINADAKKAPFGLDKFDHIIENRLEGSLHPVKLVKALYLKALKLGVQIINGVAIDRIEKAAIITLQSGKESLYTCHKLIVTTNAFAKQLLPDIDVAPRRGQVFITNELKSLTLKGCFHYDHGYYYFRNVGKRLLMGGARNADFKNEETDQFNTTEKIQNTLLDFTKKYIIPKESFTIDQQWSGIMGFGKEKKPIIQELEKNIFCAVRMSGMGVALAPIVAQELADLVTEY